MSESVGTAIDPDCFNALQHAMGSLDVGTTEFGGASGDGVVFKLTGTGFVPGTPFAAFGAKLVIQFGKTPNHDFFEMGSSFTLGSARNGINPAAEPVTLQIGTFAVTFPPGSFTGKGWGRSISPIRSMGSPWMW
jgi:hypothetical protein